MKNIDYLGNSLPQKTAEMNKPFKGLDLEVLYG